MYVNRIKAILSERDRAQEELKRALEVHAELEEALSQTKRKMQDDATKHISEEAQAFQNKILAMEEAAAEAKESHDMEMLTIREKYKANHVAVVDRLHRMETEHREVLSNLREEWEKEKSVEKVVYETDSRKLHSLEHNLQMSQHEAAALREQVKALQRSLEEEKSARRNLNLEKQNTRFEGYETEQKLNQLVRESKSSAVRSSYVSSHTPKRHEHNEHVESLHSSGTRTSGRKKTPRRPPPPPPEVEVVKTRPGESNIGSFTRDDWYNQEPTSSESIPQLISRMENLSADNLSPVRLAVDSFAPEMKLSTTILDVNESSRRKPPQYRYSAQTDVQEQQRRSDPRSIFSPSDPFDLE